MMLACSNVVSKSGDMQILVTTVLPSGYTQYTGVRIYFFIFIRWVYAYIPKSGFSKMALRTDTRPRPR